MGQAWGRDGTGTGTGMGQALGHALGQAQALGQAWGSQGHGALPAAAFSSLPQRSRTAPPDKPFEQWMYST